MDFIEFPLKIVSGALFSWFFHLISGFRNMHGRIHIGDFTRRALRRISPFSPCSGILDGMTIPEGDFAAYIFDCDGTLGDTMPLHYRAWRAALEGHGCEFPEALFYELGGVPTERIVEILNERHGCHMPVKETARYKEELYLKGIEQIVPIEPVVAVVHAVYGKLPIAVASGGHRAIVTRTLTCLGIADKFNAIVCAEDYKQGKPHPDPFLTAAARLGVAPEKCLVFEDTNTGIEAAKAAGMRWVLVPPPLRPAAGQP